MFIPVEIKLLTILEVYSLYRMSKIDLSLGQVELEMKFINNTIESGLTFESFLIMKRRGASFKLPRKTRMDMFVTLEKIIERKVNDYVYDQTGEC